MRITHWIRGLFRPQRGERTTPGNDVPRILRLRQPGERLLLAGRSFRAVPAGRGPLVQDLHFMRLLEHAGLDRVPLGENETAEAYAERLLRLLIGAPNVLSLLGCLVVPEEMEPEDWTPRTGQETADFLGRLIDEEDKAEVRRLLVSVLIPFLESGTASLRRSTSSSGAPAEASTGAG